MPEQEAFVDVAFPDKGIDLTRAFGQQAMHSTVTGQNVRLFEHETERARGGSRQGLAQYIPAQVPAGHHLIQHLNSIVHPGGSALLSNVNFNPPVFASPTDNFPGMPPPGSPVADLLPFISVGPDGWGGGKPIRSGPLWYVPVGGTGIQWTRMIRTTYAGGFLTPIIAWSDPAPIFVGTPLGVAQLNALAQDPFTNALVPGTYIYTPILGTVLPLGNHQPILMRFVPNDLAHYFSPIDRTAYIDVVKLEFVSAAHGTSFWGAVLTPHWADCQAGSISAVKTGDLIVAVLATASSNGGLPGSFPDVIHPDTVQSGVWLNVLTSSQDPGYSICGNDFMHSGFTQAASQTVIINGITYSLWMWWGIARKDSDFGFLTINNNSTSVDSSGDATGTGFMALTCLQYRGAVNLKTGTTSSHGDIGALMTTTGILPIAAAKKLLVASFIVANDPTFTAGSGYNLRDFHDIDLSADPGFGLPNLLHIVEDRFPVNSPAEATGTLDAPEDYFGLGVALKVT